MNSKGGIEATAAGAANGPGLQKRWPDGCRLNLENQPIRPEPVAKRLSPNTGRCSLLLVAYLLSLPPTPSLTVNSIINYA